jgi:hypothetical protein
METPSTAGCACDAAGGQCRDRRTGSAVHVWGAFLNRSARNVIIIGEPQFYGKKGVELDERAYIRVVKANLPLERDLLEGIVRNPAQWEPTNNFCSIGDVLGTFTILGALAFRSSIPAEGKLPPNDERRVKSSRPPCFAPELTTPSRTPGLDSIPGTNLIVLGNLRTNSVYAHQQGIMAPTLELTRWTIRNRATERTYKNCITYHPKEQSS